jgi:hypothetical protein
MTPSPILRLSRRCSTRARSMRWMQKVHFSITPRERTVTSGFMRSRSTGVTSLL